MKTVNVFQGEGGLVDDFFFKSVFSINSFLKMTSCLESQDSVWIVPSPCSLNLTPCPRGW